MVAMLGQARYVCVIGRANLIPTWFAKVNGSTGTPVNASLLLGASLTKKTFSLMFSPDSIQHHELPWRRRAMYLAMCDWA